MRFGVPFWLALELVLTLTTLCHRAAYLFPIATVETPSAYARDEALADQLWDFSERAVKELAVTSA